MRSRSRSRSLHPSRGIKKYDFPIGHHKVEREMVVYWCVASTQILDMGHSRGWKGDSNPKTIAPTLNDRWRDVPYGIRRKRSCLPLEASASVVQHVRQSCLYRTIVGLAGVGYPGLGRRSQPGSPFVGPVQLRHKRLIGPSEVPDDRLEDDCRNIFTSDKRQRREPTSTGEW